jgi:hypothetical protein
VELVVLAQPVEFSLVLVDQFRRRVPVVVAEQAEQRGGQALGVVDDRDRPPEQVPMIPVLVLLVNPAQAASGPIRSRRRESVGLLPQVGGTRRHAAPRAEWIR